MTEDFGISFLHLVMKLQGIIFDLDGTLADTMTVCLQAFQETLQHFSGKGISLSELHSLFGPNEEGIVHGLLPEQAEEAYRYFLTSYERWHMNCKQPFVGVETVLDDLRSNGMRVAIATGKSVETAEISMRFLGLASRIERIETGFYDRGDKPELIRRVLEGWCMSPDQVAYVGDVLSDLHAAEQAGVVPIGAAWAKTSPLRNIEPEEGWLVFWRVEDLAAWLLD